MDMKKKSSQMQIWIAITVLVLAGFSCGPTVVTTQTPNNNGSNGPGPTPGGSLSRSDLIAATVQIFGAYIQNGDLVPVGGCAASDLRLRCWAAGSLRCTAPI